MKKRIFAVVAMLCVAVAGHGQYFEWAKGFASQQSDNAIVGTVADSAGNLYILANFRNDAVWDDSLRLLPIAPYGPAHNNINTMIAKMTPDGNIAWRKVVHANNGADSYAWDIKLVGDTSFAVTLSTRMPTWESEYLYWLDTLVAGVSDYPVPQGNMAGASISAFVVFGFDGTVKEQHFLRMTAIDNDGYDIYFMNSLQDGLFPLTFSELKFDVDGDGNIYICYPTHYITDSAHSATLGTITAVKIWVDQHVVGTIDVDTSSRLMRPALLKFSPNFEEILSYRNIVQKSENREYEWIISLKAHFNNIYIMGYVNRRTNGDNIIVVDSTRNLTIHMGAQQSLMAVLLNLDTSLTPFYCLEVHDSIVNSQGYAAIPTRIMFRDIDFDDDSNYIFVSGYARKNSYLDTVSNNSYFIIDGTVMPFMRDGFVLILNREDMRLIKYCEIKSKLASYISGSRFNFGNLKAKNNRVFLQNGYCGGIRYPSLNINLPSIQSQGGLSVAIFDYSGKIIRGINYNSISPSNYPGPISIKDSTVYLMNSLNTSADFGGIHIPDNGWTVSIAKYVDTAFLTPYRPQPTGVVTVLPEGNIVIAPNPAHNEISVKALDAPAKGVFITSTDGKRQEARLLGGKIDISHLPQGVYFLEIVTENDKYTTKFIKL